MKKSVTNSLKEFPLSRTVFQAMRCAGLCVVSGLLVVDSLTPQAYASPVPEAPSASTSTQKPLSPSQHDLTRALHEVAESLHARTRSDAVTSPAAGQAQSVSPVAPAVRQHVPGPVDSPSAVSAQKTVGSATTVSQREYTELDGGIDEEALPAGMNRGVGYDQITSLALQNPHAAWALRMLARSEREGQRLEAADPEDSEDTDEEEPEVVQSNDPAVAGVLSLDNGPILYQPPCPFGWPPPDRYGGLADIIDLAPMAGDFISEGFAPAAAWQPMAELFGPLIAIIQPTIKQNRYWIDPTIINVRNPINAIHFLFFGWYDVWHRQKFLEEEVEWGSQVAPWLQQFYQTPQAACFVAFEGMFQRLIETGNPWPRGWYVEEHATTWDVSKIGPYEPASPGSRPKALEELDHKLELLDGDGEQATPSTGTTTPPADATTPPLRTEVRSSSSSESAALKSSGTPAGASPPGASPPDPPVPFASITPGVHID